MIDFLSSLSVVGWILIGLAALTLWQLPGILRMAWHMMTKGGGSGLTRDRVPGQDALDSHRDNM